MDVLKYFLIFLVGFMLADVDCFPAKNRHEKSASRHKKQGPEKRLLQAPPKRPKNVHKRPKRTIPPELIARHHETLRCLRQYLQNQRLGVYQPYSLPIIRNPIQYRPNYLWTPNHPPFSNIKHNGKIDASVTDKNGKIKIHNQTLKTNVHPHVSKKGVEHKEPEGLGVEDEGINRNGEEGVLVDADSKKIENVTEKTTPGFHSFNATTASVRNDYEVHETVEEDEWKNHLTERETGTTEEYKQGEEELVTEAWESKKIQEDEDVKEDEVSEGLAEPIDLLRIKEKTEERKLEEATEPMLRGSEATTASSEEGRYVEAEVTDRKLEVTTEVERHLEVTTGKFDDARSLEVTTSEPRLLETATSFDARNIEVTTSEARILESGHEVAFSDPEATSEARFLGPEATELERTIEATTSDARFFEDETSKNAATPEVRLLETEINEVTSRNEEDTTADARFLEESSASQEAVTPDARFFQDDTTPDARFFEESSPSLEAATPEARDTTPDARFFQEDTIPGATNDEASESTTPEQSRFLDGDFTSDRDYPETTISFEQPKQERKLHHDSYLESNDIDQTYPTQTEASDVSYDEENTNFVGLYKPTPMEINQILHVNQTSKNLTSLSQTINTSTEKRRSDILITDEYSEANFTRYSEPPVNFNPESLIQLIPVIIHDLRNKSIPNEDMKVLSEVFGQLWPFIQQLSQNPNVNITQLLNVKKEEDLENLITLFGKLQEQNEDLEIAETESFSYSTIPSLYDYVDDQQEIAYDPPDEEIIEEEKETEFHPRSSDFSNFGEFQNDFNGFESEDIPEDVPETFGEPEYELAEDISDGYYESNPSVIELFHTDQAHDAVKNVRLPSSKPKFPESPFSDNDNFFL